MCFRCLVGTDRNDPLCRKCSTPLTKGLSNWYVLFLSPLNFEQRRPSGAMTRVAKTIHLPHNDVGPTEPP